VEAHGEATSVLIEARGIAKRFGPVTALADASLSCNSGEIHALLGANGAGKSTFVKILTGALSPDAGQIFLKGEPVRLVNPAQAARTGIATVFQELSLFPQRTVAENIVAGREPRNRWGLVNGRAMRARARALFERLAITDIRPDERVSDLSLAKRQLVEICKALSHDPRVLILDEATSALPLQDVEKLFELLAVLKSQGLAIIFISHRMAELRRIADRMTVLRDGRTVASLATAGFDEADVVEKMLGRRLGHSLVRTATARTPRSELLRVERLSIEGQLSDISFTLGRGEVIGLTGLESQGQTELLLALFGVYRRVGGKVAVDGREVRLTSPWRAKAAGMALIPSERKTTGALLPLSIRENIALALLSRLSRFGFMRRAEEKRLARDLLARLEIVASSVEAPVSSLSGGNQQKVVLAKWFATGASVFLFYDPTRGIDIGAKEAVYRLIRELAESGKGILLYSTETEELAALCDRVLVMDRGRLVATLAGSDINAGSLMRAGLGLVGAPAATPVGKSIATPALAEVRTPCAR
jgi:ribose transport system ATP-binding protein